MCNPYNPPRHFEVNQGTGTLEKKLRLCLSSCMQDTLHLHGAGETWLSFSYFTQQTSAPSSRRNVPKCRFVRVGRCMLSQPLRFFASSCSLHKPSSSLKTAARICFVGQHILNSCLNATLAWTYLPQFGSLTDSREVEQLRLGRQANSVISQTTCSGHPQIDVKRAHGMDIPLSFVK